MKLPLYSIYLLYTSIIALVMILLIPRKDIKSLALLGVLYGSILDILWILVISFVGGGGYLNYGPLGFIGIPFMPPISWTFFFIIFLFLLPRKKPWNYIFTLVASGYSVFFSNVLSNLGIFQWTFSKVIFPSGIYLTWFFFVTWSYNKYGRKLVKKLDYE